MEEFNTKNSSMDTLPIDLIYVIFARLPIKSLLRLKTVCKSWHTIITSTNFINFHLHQNSLSYTNQLLIFASRNRHSLYSVPLTSLESSPPTKLSFSHGDVSFSSISGSCNGLLLCLCSINTRVSDVCLVNPSMLEYKRIPKLHIPRNSLYVNYGFGYDHEGGDYKIVRIVNFVYGCEDGSIFNAREVMLYSLRSNSWRFIEEKISNYASLASRNGALVNNHLLHWMFWCTSMNEHRISSFDVCNEKWGEVSMPEYYRSGVMNRGNEMDWVVCDGEDKQLDVVDLGILKGCLCLVTRGFWTRSDDVDVWVMKKYGVKDSWVRLFNIADLDVTRCLKMAPLAYAEDGEEILLKKDENSSVFWYNSREKRARIVEFSGLADYHGVSTCIQSLVPLVGYGSRVDDER